ncbi:hypothetical protein C8F04DRAFT_957319 [Mycena alexandri]|uniref:Uncharacterized protein n=1 Tax=Mycena alexandri TaxID=1745969 RepID=A0AAD6STH6_9AGAR|nr:hypothetical protein C8F04DRAFT_957319 [Mycena alexandri]
MGTGEAAPISATAASLLLQKGARGSSSGSTPEGEGNSGSEEDGELERARWDETIPPCPVGAADWFVSTYTQITKVQLGGVFNSLLASYGELERSYNWAKGGNNSLGKKDNRPVQLSQWVAAGRGSRGGKMGEDGPTIDSLAVYDDRWWRWWGKLQPGWRVGSAGNAGRFVRTSYPPQERPNWASLHLPGPNGILGVVATLYWWGKKVKEGSQREDTESWVEAVTDVKWMVKGLLAMERATAE